MLERIMRILRLDAKVFREIEEDPNATVQAGIIVVVVSLLSAIGSGIAARTFFGSFFWELFVGVAFAWVLWAVVTYFVGTSLFQGKSSIEGMLRVLGYARIPGVLGFFSFIPCVGWIAALAGAVLSLIAGVLAISEAMDFDMGKAIITVLIGWAVYLLLSILLAPVIGVSALIFR